MGSILERKDLGKRRQEGYPAGMGGGARDGGPLGLGVRRDTGCGEGPVVGLAVAGAARCIVAALASAGGVVTQKPLLDRVSALQVTWLASGAGAIACLPFAPALLRELGQANASAVGWAVYLRVFPTAVAFTTWAYALARTTAGRMGSTTYLIPPVAVLMGWMILGEAPPALALLGGALCLAGVAVARR